MKALVTKEHCLNSELMAGFLSWRNWCAVTWHRGLRQGWYTVRLQLTFSRSTTVQTTNPLYQRDFILFLIVSYKNLSILHPLSNIIGLNPENKKVIWGLKKQSKWADFKMQNLIINFQPSHAKIIWSIGPMDVTSPSKTALRSLLSIEY